MVQGRGRALVQTWWRRENGHSASSMLQKEIDRLTQENMRLRLERQRPQSISALAAELRAGAAQIPGPATEDAVDDAYHVMAQTEVLRQSVLDVLDGLLVAAGQMQRHLLHDVPLMEIDRRVVDRRESRREVLDVSAP